MHHLLPPPLYPSLPTPSSSSPKLAQSLLSRVSSPLLLFLPSSTTNATFVSVDDKTFIFNSGIRLFSREAATSTFPLFLFVIDLFSICPLLIHFDMVSFFLSTAVLTEETSYPPELELHNLKVFFEKCQIWHFLGFHSTTPNVHA